MKGDFVDVHKLKPHFLIPPGKNDPHIRVLAGIQGSGWGKLGGENSLGLRAFSGRLMRSKYAVFWQTKQNLGVFSTGTEKRRFTGFSGISRDIIEGNKAQNGLIFP